MKIRNGFVSNSSSSSFVLFGIETKANSITPALLKQRRYSVLGGQLYEGVDLFELNEELLAAIKAVENIYGCESPFTIYEELGGGRIDLSKLPKEGFAVLEGGECDQHSSYNLGTFFDNYCGEYGCEDYDFDKDKIKLEMEKFMRKEKLEKLNKI